MKNEEMNAIQSRVEKMRLDWAALVAARAEHERYLERIEKALKEHQVEAVWRLPQPVQREIYELAAKVTPLAHLELERWRLERAEAELLPLVMQLIPNEGGIQ